MGNTTPRSRFIQLQHEAKKLGFTITSVREVSGTSSFDATLNITLAGQ